MGWWPSLIVLTVGFIGFVVIAVLPLAPVARVRRTAQLWRTDVQEATGPLRSGVAGVRARRARNGRA